MEHTKTPWIAKSQGCNVYALTSGDIVIALFHRGDKPGQNKANAEFIVKAVNSHDELVAALEAWQKVESEMSNNTPCPDLALRAQYRKKAIELTSKALAKLGNSKKSDH